MKIGVIKEKNPCYYWDNRKIALRTRSQSTKAPTCRNGNLLERGVNWNWWCHWQGVGGRGDPACTQWTEECFKISLPRYTEVSTELWGDQTTIPAVNQTWLLSTLCWVCGYVKFKYYNVMKTYMKGPKGYWGQVGRAGVVAWSCAGEDQWECWICLAVQCFLRKTSAIKNSQLVCWRQRKWRGRAIKPGETQMIPLRVPELSEFMLYPVWFQSCFGSWYALIPHSQNGNVWFVLLCIVSMNFVLHGPTVESRMRHWDCGFWTILNS